MQPPEFLQGLLRASTNAALLALVVMGVQWLFRRRLSPRWRCALWGLVLMRLILPVAPQTRWSVYNWLGVDGQAFATAGERQPKTESLPTVRQVVAAGVAVRVVPTAEAPRHELGFPLHPPRSVVAEAEGGAVSVNLPLTPRPENGANSLQASAENGVGTSPSPAASLAEGEKASRVFDWAFRIWIAGVLLLGTHLVLSSVRWSRRIAAAAPVSDPGVLALLAECRQLMGVQGNVGVVESPWIGGPALCGFLRPRLLLPAGFTTETPREELRYVFLHELGHVKRHDIALNWLVTLLQVLHWFNPVLWLAFARFRADRELACDALALTRALTRAGEEASEAYGRTILNLLQRVARPTVVPGLVGILEDRDQLRRRIAMIASFRPAPRWSALGLALCGLLAVFTLTDARSADAASEGKKLPPVWPVSLTNLFVPAENADWRRPGWQGVPRGTNELAGVEFHLEGLLQLQGTGPRDAGKKYRESITIPVPTNTWGAVHLIAGTSYDAKPGTRIADVVWRYTDKTMRRVPIEYAVHTRDWWRAPYEDPARVRDTNSKVVWRGVHEESAAYGKTLRLYKTTLANPQPTKRVRAVELSSAMAQPALIVAALTLDPLAPGVRPDPSADLELVDPPLTSHLFLSIVDETDGKGVPDVEVQWSVRQLLPGGKESTFKGTATNDANGSLQIDLPATHLAGLELRANKEGYPAALVRWTLGNGVEQPAQHTLKFRGGLTIGGMVLDPEGNPVPNTSVTAFRYSMGGDPQDIAGEQSDFARKEFQTDASGHWRMTGVPKDLVHRISVTAHHPDYLNASLMPIGGNPATLKELTELRHELTLQRGVDLNGRVEDGLGAGIPGAKVAFGRPNFGNRRDATTDADGRFQLRNLNLKPGDIGFETEPVSAAAPGYQAGFTNVAVAATLPEVVIRLAKGRALRGRVVNKKGEPLEGTQVILEGHQSGPRSFAPWDFKTVTDADGRFVWDGAPAEALEFVFFKTGYQALREVKLQPSVDDLDVQESIITMTPTAVLVGRVVDAQSGQPVKRFTLWPGEGDGSRFTSWGESDRRDFADENGQFEFELHESQHNTLRVEADDFGPKFVKLPENREGRVPLDLALDPSPGLRGQVFSPDGRPAAGATVVVWPVDGSPVVSYRRQGLQVDNRQGAQMTRADAEGRFRLQSMGAAPCSLAAMDESGYLQRLVTPSGDAMRLDLLAFGALEGDFSIAGQPVAGTRFTVQLAGGVHSMDGALEATTDARGHFRIERIPAGQHTLSRMVQVSANSWSYSHGKPVEVPPGATARVDMQIEGAVLSGVAVLPESARSVGEKVVAGSLETPMIQPPAPFQSAAEVQAWTDSAEVKAFWKNRRQYHFTVGSDGRFSVDGIAPGRYELKLSASKRSATVDFGVDVLASANVPITVPDSADPSQPILLGPIELKPEK